nr:phosphotransferase [Chloroflexia bacterium]
MLDASLRAEVQAILTDHGLPHTALSASDGFANLVVLTPDHVIRLNGGRFPNAFRHEATVLNHLPRTIPHPVAVAHGARKSGGEFLIVERLPGENLEQAWPRLNQSDRGRILGELGRMMKCLHDLPVAGWMHNPWVSDALATGQWRDAYHAPPRFFLRLIASAANERPDLQGLLRSVSGFITARLNAFDDGPESFTHTDLHFRNVIVNGGHVTGL